MWRRERERGSASVEQAGLAALVALLLLVAIAAVAAGGEVDSGSRPGRDDRQAARLRPRGSPTPAGTTRWSRPTAGRWRAWRARSLRRRRRRPGPSGLPLAPVDFRRCRRESCAVAAGTHLTASGRRTTAFTELVDRRRSLGWVEIVYWLYRPTLGWERVVRRAGRAQIDAAARVEVLLGDDPALVPLETLPGRNHYEFPAGERPPWQWRVGGRYPGWSS